jgi:hypothetical protein
MKNARE